MHAPADVPPPARDRPVRVVHFVTGGFSGGATQVAIALAQAGVESPAIEPLLVLRRKRRTDPRRIAELEQAGVPVRVVPGWSHAATIWALVRLCREFRPDILVAHGFSEHLWGRYAGLLARVPHLVHVEHNTRERYTRWRLAQTRWLARRTDRIVGCSEGVRQRLIEMGMPPERTIAIPNGIRLEPFAEADAHPVAARIRGIVMVARVSKQKDHATLIRAVARLRDRGLTPPVLFAGGGKAIHRKPIEKLVELLGVQDQVQFLGVATAPAGRPSSSSSSGAKIEELVETKREQQQQQKASSPSSSSSSSAPPARTQQQQQPDAAGGPDQVWERIPDSSLAGID